MLSPLFTWRGAIADSSLPSTSRLVALVLSLHMNERGSSAYPSIGRLMSETGLSRRAVQQALRVLQATGYLRAVAGTEGGRRASGAGIATTYVATLPSAVEKGAPRAPLRAHVATEKGAPRAPEDVREESVRATAYGGHDDETSGSSSETNHTAVQRLVGLFVSESRRIGVTLPKRTIGHEAREIGALLAEGFAEEMVDAAIRRQVDKGLAPAVLASLMVDVQRKPTPRVPVIKGRRHDRYTAA